MSKPYNFVSIKVDKNFFDKMFEPERKKLELKFDKRISQPKFTEFLFKSGGKLWFPKQITRRKKSNNFNNWEFGIKI
jgi:hypothetical protein